MKNAIFTSSDKKYGNFLINHWLASLEKNVNLTNIDIIILDYGLSRSQINKLKKKKIIIKKCIKNGRVNHLRFRDVSSYLKNHKYDQVLSIDGGDIIIQSDLKKLFNQNKKSIRASCEDFNFDFNEFNLKFFVMKKGYMKNSKKYKKYLLGKKMINAGVIIGPSIKIFTLFDDIYEISLMYKENFLSDQIATNIILYKQGFKILDSKYNYVITTMNKKFFISNGIFYYKNKKRIPIVHNIGGIAPGSLMRPIKNFGFGPEYNQVKWVYLYTARTFIFLTNLFTNFVSKIMIFFIK